MIKKLILFIVLLHLTSIYGFRIQKRSFNGILSQLADFKFYVQITDYYFFPEMLCGGVLISDKWILTAGHCLSNKSLIASFGPNEIGSYTNDMRIPITHQHIHPKFYKNSIYSMYDLALLELPTKVVSNAFFQPVNISTKCGTDLDNIDVVAVGKGKTAFNGDLDFVLRHVHAKIMPSAECEDYSKKFNETMHVMCAEPLNGSYLLHGDSGGPLMQRSDNKLIGISSYIDGDGSTYPPIVQLQVFTRVHSYFDWIREVTGLEMPVCDK